MERVALADLSDQSRNFTTTIVVLRKQPPKTSRSGTVKMQNLIFEHEGVQMRATIFEQDIDLFGDTLHEGKEYDITNPLISRMPDYLIRNEQQYQMTIKSTTKVTETQSSIHNQISETSYWVSLDAVNDYIGKSDRIDIVGVAIHVHEIRTVTSQTTGRTYDIRDIQLTDTSLTPITLSVWSTLATHEAEQIAEMIDSFPIIQVTRVVAKNFDGAKWNSSPLSTIKINTDSPTTSALHNWVVENTEKIYELKTSIANLSNENTEQNGHSDVLISLLPEQQAGKNVRIKGKITEISNKHSLIYDSCNVCNKKCNANIGEEFTCSTSSTPHAATAEPKCILHVDIENSSGKIPMTLFGHHAEFVLDKKAIEISLLSMQERRIFIEETVEKLKDKYFNIELTTYMLGDNKQLRWKTKEITYATV
ncbi:replication protein A 70 kDa DNA-binding subunit B-like [Beta vulgaris subsp. vulgaris]|uniref:replication protein A 70 kDa DNA-binding subunit B-like n=1 Tax=Beta vulgaris subsp. vulgaris TaxID=3555 RepID=UPI00053FBF27|nr:replication protein A 70 kDa DNA-binding subunit B-like [Beta vulgaris subsp. vulgaris]XP_057250413.1 replication protein A 70 kDa DNA-binding subunit B-like [Beta vulgaris subsp. vulgaris]